MSRRPRSLFLALLLASTASAAPFSVVEPGARWSKDAVRVCWAVGEDLSRSRLSINDPNLVPADLHSPTTEERSVVRSIVSSEFTPDATGIEFTGWQPCAQTPDADLYLFSMTDEHAWEVSRAKPGASIPEGRGTIGERGAWRAISPATEDPASEILLGWDRESLEPSAPYPSLRGYYGHSANPLKSYVFLKIYQRGRAPLDRTNYLRLTALHEFGHAAGLRHEHARSQAADSPLCALTKTTLDERLAASTAAASTYDPISVMNYCWIFFVRDHVGLRYYQAPDAVANANDAPEDPTKVRVFRARKLGLPEVSRVLARTTLDPSGLTQVDVAVALSEGDRHALRCLYDRERETWLGHDTCRGTYDPYAPPAEWN